MTNFIKLIKNSQLLDKIDEGVLAGYYKAGKISLSKYNRNNIIHYEGDDCLELEIILEGRVVIERIDEEGSLMSIAEFGVDDIIGGNLLFSKSPVFPMTITANSKTTIIKISRDELVHLLSENIDFMVEYLAYISDNASHISGKLKDNMGRSIRKKLIAYINYERKIQHSDTIELKKSKKAMAESFGIQRTSLSRELKKMKDEGLIEFNNKFIRVLRDF